MRAACRREQPRLIDLDARLGDRRCSRHALVGDGLAEGGARQRAAAQRFERALGNADLAHAMVDAAGAEAALRDLEAAPLAEQHVGGRHAHVLEQDLGVAVRRVVVAEHGQRPHDRDAGRVHRHEDHRLLAVARPVRVGPAHQDRDRAARVHGAGGPPFAAVDDVVVAVAADRALDVGRVGGGDGGLGHREAGADLAGEQRLSQRSFCSGVP